MFCDYNTTILGVCVSQRVNKKTYLLVLFSFFYKLSYSSQVNFLVNFCVG